MNPVVTLAQGGVLPIEKSGTDYMLQYGVVGILCVVFAYIIIYLYRENRTDRREAVAQEKAHAVELAACKEQCRTEKESLEKLMERRHREVLEGYTLQVAQLRQSAEKREDDLRREFAALAEKLAAGNKESSEALVEMLQQFLNKVVK